MEKSYLKQTFDDLDDHDLFFLIMALDTAIEFCPVSFLNEIFFDIRKKFEMEDEN